MQGRVYKGPPPGKHPESGTKTVKKIVFKAPTTGPTNPTATKVAKTKGDTSKRSRAKALNIEHDGMSTCLKE